MIMSEEKCMATEEVYKKYPFLKKLNKEDIVALITAMMIFMLTKAEGNDHLFSAIKSLLSDIKD